ncbi:hypothetical protein DL96DRAFT_233963 [Flagelloscypha sp. PMI_526]|nr:hypothetical protein DL96DRAFT_233963 [Flagelloscypha sp. PMI_526]
MSSSTARLNGLPNKQESLRKSVDVLLALLLLGLPKDQSVNNPSPEEQPSNTISLPEVPDPTAAPGKPGTIGDLLGENHLISGPTKYERKVKMEVNDTHGKRIEDTAILKNFIKVIKPRRLKFGEQKRCNLLLNFRWDRDSWPVQVPRVITNEACVDAANTLNVVEPVVAAIEICLQPFLSKLNSILEVAFDKSFKYSIQVRHECPTATGGRSDILITLEFSLSGKIPDVFYYINESDKKLHKAGDVRWASAERFSARLMEIYEKVVGYRNDIDKGPHKDFQDDGSHKKQRLKLISREIETAPSLVLHIIEDKVPAVIDRRAFEDPDSKQRDPDVDVKAYENARAIIPQLKRYTLEYCCPWITLSDYFNYLTFRIDPDAVEARLAIQKKVFSNEYELTILSTNQEPERPRLLKNEGNTPRRQIFFAIVDRLYAAGILTYFEGLGGFLPDNPVDKDGKLALRIVESDVKWDWNER